MVKVNFINDDGIMVGSQSGFMMSYHDKTVVFTPFTHDKKHFTHTKKAFFMIDDMHVEMTESEYIYPFFLRMWSIPYNGMNSASDYKVNFPKKNHCYDDNNISYKINDIIDCDFNGWHISLPPIYVNVIKNKKIDIGTVTYINNNITGIVILNNKEDSIVLGMYFLKKLMQSCHIQYAGIYYGFAENNNKIIVKEDWQIYTNLLQVGDVLLEMEDTPVKRYMHNSIIDKDIYIDTWIAWMYLMKDTLSVKISRNNVILTVEVPCIPLHHIMQYKYYSDKPDDVTFENMHLYRNNDRFRIIGEEIKNNPNKLFM